MIKRQIRGFRRSTDWKELWRILKLRLWLPPADSLYGLSTSQEEQPPTLKCSNDFIDQHIANTKMLSPTNKHLLTAADRCPSTFQPTHNSSKDKNKSQSHSLHIEESKPDVCSVCDDSHTIYQCTAFKEWPPEQRLTCCKSLCFNNLGNNQNCSSHRTCKKCKPQHPSFLLRSPSNVTPAGLKNPLQH